MSGAEGKPAGLLAAEKIVEWGGRVVPGFVSKEGQKVPLGGDWVKGATKDLAALAHWWQRWPWAWPGVVSGVDSFIVLDCDRPVAVDWMRGLVAGTGGWGECRGGWIYKTPGRGGGLHCMWAWPSWLSGTFRQAKVQVDGGGEVQLRGAGHFTLTAGARRRDGAYEVLEEPGDGERLVEAPVKLLKSFLAESVVSVGRVQNAELSEISPEDAWNGAPYTDGRKNAVAGLAWYLAIRGRELSEVMDTCVAFGAECCLPVLDAETCEKKAEYAVKRAERFRAESVSKTNELLKAWGR